jgi:hypothetical protein
MKTIILISSIFYILGLKIGNKIELVKKSDSNEKIITQKVKEKEPTDCCKYSDELANKTTCDTVQGGSSYSDALLKIKE